VLSFRSTTVVVLGGGSDRGNARRGCGLGNEIFGEGTDRQTKTSVESVINRLKVHAKAPSPYPLPTVGERGF